MQCALNYSGTRFLPWLKIKITQFPGGFRHNLLEWKYYGTEPFHSNCSEGERLKRLPRLAQLSGQCNITVPRRRQKLLAWTALACLQQLSVISRSSLGKCENCQWAMRSASRKDTLHEHCCYVVFQGAFEFIKRKIIHRSAQNPAEFSNFESSFA